MGKVDPGCRLLVEGPFGPGDVATRIVADRRPTTPDLEERIERSWRAALALAESEGRRLFNGDVLRWIDAQVRAGDEGRRLELTVAPSTYREFVGTNMDASLEPDVAGGPVPWSRFGNAVGTSAVVVARDGVLVAGRRSKTVVGYAGCVHAFGGMLEGVDVDGRAVDVFASLMRELKEELGVQEHEIHDPVLEGVILEPLIHQPEMIFHVHASLSFEELRTRWTRAESGDEHAELIGLAEAPADPDAEIERLGAVSPIGRAALALYWSRRTG